MSDSSLILAAGMPRSGSTWLYNAARLLISSSPSMTEKFSCGWIGDWKHIPQKKYMLIKIHKYDKNVVARCNCILYSYRDIRDVIASKLRKFGTVPSIELADNLVSQHEQWIHAANFVMRYESMLRDKEDIISQLIDVLGVHNIDPKKIVESIEELKYESQGSKNATYHKTNLFHRGHITDGKHGSWKGLVNANLVKEIEERHKDWFEKYGY